MASSLNETLVALGRGIVKVTVSAFFGTGVGLIAFGFLAQDKPEIWQSRTPPGEMFLAVGAGLLTTGTIMALAFAVPGLLPRRAEERSKPEPVEEWAR